MLYIQNVKYLKPTFNLPDLQDRIPWYGGATIGQKLSGGLPDLYGNLAMTNGNSVLCLDGLYYGGVFSLTSQTQNTKHYSTSSNPTVVGHSQIQFQASSYKTSYGRYNNDKVIPEAIQMYWYIKY